MNYDEVLAPAGMRLTRDGNTWKVEPAPDATAAQVKVREGWVSGKTG
jgi:hypothetical protein